MSHHQDEAPIERDLPLSPRGVRICIGYMWNKSMSVLSIE